MKLISLIESRNEQKLKTYKLFLKHLLKMKFEVEYDDGDDMKDNILVLKSSEIREFILSPEYISVTPTDITLYFPVEKRYHRKSWYFRITDYVPNNIADKIIDFGEKYFGLDIATNRIDTDYVGSHITHYNYYILRSDGSEQGKDRALLIYFG